MRITYKGTHGGEMIVQTYSDGMVTFAADGVVNLNADQVQSLVKLLDRGDNIDALIDKALESALEEMHEPD